MHNWNSKGLGNVSAPNKIENIDLLFDPPIQVEIQGSYIRVNGEVSYVEVYPDKVLLLCPDLECHIYAESKENVRGEQD